MVDVDRELAMAQLTALQQVPGALKIITAEHACGIPAVPGEAFPSKAEDQKVCSDFALNERDSQDRPVDLAHPRHYVLHDVTQIEDIGGGIVRASTAEGDWTEGPSMAVLNRLQQWQT